MFAPRGGSMKILMLGWEYPPHHSGSLGPACHGLSEALARRGHELVFALPEAAGDEPAGHMRVISVFDRREMTEAIGFHAQERADDERRPKRRPLEGTRSPIDVADERGNGEPPEDEAAEQGEHRYFGMHHHYGPELLARVDRFTDWAVPLLRDVPHELIHAHEWMTVPAALKLRQLTGRKVVFHVHSLESQRGEHSDPVIDDLEKWGLRDADHVITISHNAKSLLCRDYAVPEDKISVVHNGVSRGEGINRYQLSQDSLRDQKMVLFVGPLIFQKGPEYFVDAAHKVIQSYDKVRFVICGSGDKLENTIRKVNEWGLSKHFYFTGLLKGRQMERIFIEADLYVMPSVFDPFGFLPLEAITYDTPVIVSKQSGVTEILRHALTVDFWDVNRMAELMLAVLRYDALTKDMTEMARRELLTLHWRAAAEKVADLYPKILNA